MMETLRIFLWQMIELVVMVLPYYAMGVLLAGFLDVYAGRGALRRRLLGAGWAAVILAAFLGAVIPVCSCGVVPVVIGLVAGGVPIAPAITFLISAPMMNPATFTMTYGALGSDIAVARLVCALALSITVGLVVSALERAGWLRAERDLSTAERICPCAWSGGPAPRGVRRFLRGWLRGGEILVGFSRYIAVGIVLGATIATFVGREWVMRYLTGSAGVPLAALVGVPLYVCTCSEIPVSVPLVELGMSKAALVTFLLAGPGVSVFSLILIASLLRRRLLVLYVVSFLAGSMLLGSLAGLVLPG